MSVLKKAPSAAKVDAQTFKSWKKGSVKVKCNARISRADHWIHVDVTLWGPEPERNNLYKVLKEHSLKRKKEFEEKGGVLKSNLGGNNEESYIKLVMSNKDPNSEKDWPIQHKWLADRIAHFLKVFDPLIENYNSSI